MSHRHLTAGIAVLSGLSACAPLQQAPLVYSSKLVVGVDVSANVAENQGGSVNIGIKSIDSAYVPVAVSKEIDKKGQDQEKTLEIRLIEARYGEGTTPETSDEATTAERNRKIDAYFGARQAADAAAAAQTAAENKVSGLTSLVAQLDSLKSGIVTAQGMLEPPPSADSAVPAPNPKVEALKQRAADLDRLNADKGAHVTALVQSADGTFNTKQVLIALDERIGALVKAKADAEAALPELKAQRQSRADQALQAKTEAIRVAGLSQTNKTDAMSVYGRFDSNGTGSSKDGSASLLVGKVFSTGLASQNLTEAVKIEARSRCIASGFDTAKSITETAARNAFLDGLARMCSVQGGAGNGTPK